MVVPVERASKAQEQSAASLRRKITPLLDTFLQPVPEVPLQHPSVPIDLPAFPDLFDVRDPQAALASLEVDRCGGLPLVGSGRGVSRPRHLT